MFYEWSLLTVAELLEIKRELIQTIQNEKLWMEAEHNPYSVYMHARNVGGYEYQLAYVTELIQSANADASMKEE